MVYQWYCPKCNNCDENLNMIQECIDLRITLSKITKDFSGTVICKECCKCKKKWQFMPQEMKVSYEV